MRKFFAVLRYNLSKYVPRHWFSQVCAAILLASLAVVSGLLWIEVHKRFPAIPIGSYSGLLLDAFPYEEEPVKFYAERSVDGSLLVSVLHPDWLPQLVPLAESSDGRSLFPVVLPGPNSRLRLIGEQVEPGLYAGVVTELNSGHEGRWRLRPFRAGAGALTEDAREALRHAVVLRAKHTRIEARLARMKKLVPDQRKELERLTEIIAEGEGLRAQGDKRYQEAQQRLAELDREFQEKQAEAQALREKVELAHQVTKKGRLVSLAREAAARDVRWLHSMLKGEPSELSPELRDALTHGYEVLELQKAILDEERWIRASREEPLLSGRESAVSDWGR